MVDQHFLGFHEGFPFILPVFNKPLLRRELVLEVFGELSQAIYYFFFFPGRKELTSSLRLVRRAGGWPGPFLMMRQVGPSPL